MNQAAIIFVFLISIFSSFSQEKVNEGYFVLKHSIGSDSLSTQPNSITYFKDGKIRSESTDALGVNTIIIGDAETKERLMLIDHPMYGKNSSYSKMVYSDEEKKKYKITEGKETKVILGYPCKQYIVETPHYDAFEVFISEYVAGDKKSTLFGVEIKGASMYTKSKSIVNGEKIERILEVVEVKQQKISDDKFSFIIPEDYKRE